MLVRSNVELSPRDPYCNAKMKTACMIFFFLGSVSDDIYIANLVSISGQALITSLSKSTFSCVWFIIKHCSCDQYLEMSPEISIIH